MDRVMNFPDLYDKYDKLNSFKTTATIMMVVMLLVIVLLGVVMFILHKKANERIYFLECKVNALMKDREKQ